tara:strand:- start:3202 stop:4113 length:912 start_codon:yes stop_codon:yes gene_type:complete
LIEAGHRCAIPRCGQTELDIHHIIPWETCQSHEYFNLIALCPICHRRAHNGEIDRKSLQKYKENLANEFNKNDSGCFEAEIVEIRRRLTENNDEIPGYTFQFDFPDFQQAVERIISRNIEAWGYELLAEFREMQDNHIDYVRDKNDPEVSGRPPKSALVGTYDVLRRDPKIISVRYKIDRYYSGAAHGGRTTRVQNFIIRPFRPITIETLISSKNSISEFADFIRQRLSMERRYDSDWLARGTAPKFDNFSIFNIEKHGVLFTFSEYQIDCFAAGEQHLRLSFHELKSVCDEDIINELGEYGL